MGVVSCFHRAGGVDGTHVGTTKGAIVRDVFDAGSRFGDDLTERGETAGAITDGHRKSIMSTIGCEAFFDHPA